MTPEELKERFRKFSIKIIKMVEEEIDETSHWLSVIMDAEILPTIRVKELYDESVELRRIVVRSITTARQTIEAQERPC